MRRAFAAIVLLAAIMSGCTLGDRAAHRDRIARSRQGLASDGLVSGTFKMQSRLIELPGQVSGVDRNALGGAFPALTADLVLDAGSGRASLTGLGVDFTRFDGTVAYVRRDQGRSSLGSQRAWSRLDFRDLEETSRPSVQGVLANIGLPAFGLLNPAHVIDLLAGVLAGSIEPLTSRKGEGGSRFRAKLSIEQAESGLELDEPERDARRQALRILAVKGDVVPATVALDDRDALKELAVTFTQEPVRRSRLQLVVTVSLQRSGGALSLPAEQETVRVTSPAELVGPLRAAQAGRGS